MGVFDKVQDALGGDGGGAVDKAKDLINQHEDKVDQGIEKAGDMVDDKTGGKFSGQVDQGQQFLEDKTGNL